MSYSKRFDMTKYKLEISKVITSAVLCVIQIPKIYLEIMLECPIHSIVLSVIIIVIYGVAFAMSLSCVKIMYRKINYWKGYMFNREEDDENSL